MESYNMREMEGKRAHDRFRFNKTTITNINMNASAPTLLGATRRVWVPGAVIIGAGPSGLAVAGCLKQLGIPRLILERSNCIASLWQLQTYDRLRLHLPKHLCELPNFPYPADFPTYPTKQHFISYVEAYVERFSLNPVFNREVVSAEFDRRWGLWRVKAVNNSGKKAEEEATEYVCRWVVAATGENAEVVLPQIDGLDEFRGRVMHSSEYKCGEEFRGKKVLVVGSGNSGMEVSLDLFYHSAHARLVVRDMVHVLPKEMLGTSTFALSMRLLKWLPVRMVDRILLFISYMTIGDTEELGLQRPLIGPMELKDTMGKTPVLDIGTLAEIRAGNIKTFPGIKRIFEDGVEFIDGRVESLDAIIFATGFKSNVPCWLKGSNMFSKQDGFPVKPFPDGWKGENGLYAAGFTKRGILGLSLDAKRVAEDIEKIWKGNEKQVMGSPNATLSQFFDN